MTACPRTAAPIQALQERFDSELIDYPPYSPDLALSDYQLFTYLKKWMVPQPSTITKILWMIAKLG
jgi:hypothetical protein